MTVVDAESRFHVLAVDDSIIDRKLIKMLLKTSSYQVTTVDSGSKALEVLGLRDDGDDPSSPSSSSAPDHHHQEMGVNLIITDYCMPGMTGYDLLRRVKGSSSLKDIPVVIMSSENVPARITRKPRSRFSPLVLHSLLNKIVTIIVSLMGGHSLDKYNGL